MSCWVYADDRIAARPHIYEIGGWLYEHFGVLPPVVTGVSA